MPEIPDLEAFSKNLTKALKGSTFSRLKANKRARVKPSVRGINKALTGKKLMEVYRDGKQLRFRFGDDILLGIHLMLHGEFRWATGNRPTYIVAELIFDKRDVLWLTDFHFQANLFLDPAPSTVPDVMDKKLGAAFWKKLLDTDAMIKNLLRNQDLLRGMGNAYTDEILYEAGISPFSIASKIPPAAVARLRKAIKTVYRNAAREISNNDPDVIGGEYRAFMKVHNSKREKTPAGELIRKKASGGSKTYYTDDQVLYK